MMKLSREKKKNSLGGVFHTCDVFFFCFWQVQGIWEDLWVSW